ncbi:30S ribosomal protein S2 [Lentisphaerota bacterium ZTH]|nr:30S ribosomal protein S2 [Lentisphaerota bacterium]WET06515.1 30S ribosomal protein S2 [Lentisphaerota bacterium ZTH]
MAKITIKDLLEAGCHFGHQTKRWNPQMKEYVYGAKNGISIIDLTKTMHQISDACNFLQRIVMQGGDVLFVGTKRQAQQITRELAEKTGMFYVSERWLGGTLTNNITIRQSINKMYDIDKVLQSEEMNSLKKKEQSALTRRATKLHRDLDGIASMKKLPAVMVIIDVCNDNIAVREALKLRIPTVAIVDTNGDPSNIDFPIAANDDAVKSIKVITDVLADAILVAKEVYQKRVVEEKAAKEAEKAEKAAKAAEAKAEKAAKAAEAKAGKTEAKAPKKAAAPKTEKAAPKAEKAAPKAEKAAPKAEKAPKKAAEAKAPKAEKPAEAKAEKAAEAKTEKAPKAEKSAEAKAEKAADAKAEKAPKTEKAAEAKTEEVETAVAE